MTEFEQLYERYARDVYRFALYLSGSPAQAEDIAAETFVRVWTARDRVRVATVKAYLFTIARNLHADGRRLESRQVALHDAFTDPGPGPELEAESRQELAAVLAALQQLPEVDRAALLMRAQDGMPYLTIQLLAPSRICTTIRPARLSAGPTPTPRRQQRTASHSTWNVTAAASTTWK